jgi:HK97 family phage prohead protease
MELERRAYAFEGDDEIVVAKRADGRPVIRGYAVVYDRLSLDLGGFRERILPGAFDKMLAKRGSKRDLVSYFNHDPNLLLGRESSGTLRVFSDEKGVGFEVSPPATRADVMELVTRRDVKGASFAFTVDKGGESWASDERGGTIREIREAQMYELGPVVTPAYPSTSAAVAMRSYEAWLASQSEQPEPAAPAVERTALRGVAAAWAAILRLRGA